MVNLGHLRNSRQLRAAPSMAPDGWDTMTRSASVLEFLDSGEDFHGHEIRPYHFFETTVTLHISAS